MPDRDFVDTNVLVYAMDESGGSKRDVAHAILSAADAPTRLVISTQVLCEFYVVITRKLEKPVSLDVAAEAVSQLSKLSVVGSDARLVETAVELSIERQISLWDAMIVAAASASSCDRILTEDLGDGTEFGQTRIHNPFKPGNNAH